jgi:hypothetical protein
MFQHRQFGGAQGVIIPDALLSLQGARAIGTLSCRSCKASFYYFCLQKRRYNLRSQKYLWKKFNKISKIQEDIVDGSFSSTPGSYRVDGASHPTFHCRIA